MFRLNTILTKENKRLFIKYVLVSLASYGFVFLGLFIAVDFLQVHEKLAFIIVYAINYVFLYWVQLRYLFKTDHHRRKLFRFIVFIVFFYICANLLYGIGLKLQIHYLLATVFTVVVLMPLRVIALKLFVYRDPV